MPSVLLQLHDVAVGILDVDRETDSPRAAPRYRFLVHEPDARVAEQLDRRGEVTERQAEMDKAAGARRAGVVRRVGNEVE